MGDWKYTKHNREAQKRVPMFRCRYCGGARDSSVGDAFGDGAAVFSGIQERDQRDRQAPFNAQGSVMKLWPHQQRTLSLLQERIAAGAKRICVTAPTGAGKSLMMRERCLTADSSSIYTHRRMLLDQTARGLEKAGIPFGYRAAGHNIDFLARVQLTMIQTEMNEVLRKERRQVAEVDEIHVDECHQNSAAQCLELLNRHSGVRAGWTATPLGVGHAYDELLVSATNSELRECGAHVVAHHYAPTEPDQSLVGKVKIGEGECGIPQEKRMNYAQRIYGHVLSHWQRLNPQRLPTVLFAPGVPESKWFYEELRRHGVKAAHIDGKHVLVDGEVYSDMEARWEVMKRLEAGDLEILCNRFVLREAVDAPAIYCGIFATVFGSMTSYLQAGGRVIRKGPGQDHVIVIDHGGNCRKFGSLNADREWDLQYTDKMACSKRIEDIREGKEPEPIVCPRCGAMRLHGDRCATCGHIHTGRRRPVLFADGTLKLQQDMGMLPKRVMDTADETMIGQWRRRVRAVRKSKKPTVKSMTFNQLACTFARDNGWVFPNKEWPDMPEREIDFSGRCSRWTKVRVGDRSDKMSEEELNE